MGSAYSHGYIPCWALMGGSQEVGPILGSPFAYLPLWVGLWYFLIEFREDVKNV